MRPSIRPFCLAIGLLAAGAAVFAQGTRIRGDVALALDGGTEKDLRREELYRLVKRFDFDERKRGNYEDVPMHWHKLSGAGLPAYSRGAFDDCMGQAAAPSFKLTLEAGNVAYEYAEPDLTVIPESDYLVTAQVRAEGIRHSGAFIAAYLADRFGDRIAGSECVSRVVRDSDGVSGTWKSVELVIPGAFPQAHTLRLQLWILQNSVWNLNAGGPVDPIIRNDIQVSAWFDDLAVYRLPRARFSFSNPAGLVLPGKHESILLDVHNATSHALQAEVEVLDSKQQRVQHCDVTIGTTDRNPRVLAGTASASHEAHPPTLSAEESAEPQRVALTDLPPGMYQAHLRVINDGEALLERTLRFAVLPPAPPTGLRMGDIGVDAGLWRGGSVAGLIEAVSELGGSAVRIGVPVLSSAESEVELRRLNEIGALVQEMRKRRVDVVGVLSAIEVRSGSASVQSMSELVAAANGVDRLSPTFAHLGAVIPTWQIGQEEVELIRPDAWNAEALATIRAHLKRFVTVPELVAPISCIDTGAMPDAIRSLWIPSSVPIRAMPRQVEPFVKAGEPLWLRLAGCAPAAARSTDETWDSRWSFEAQRIAMAKACGGDRLIVDAPFRRAAGGAWEPTDEFIVMRTLLRTLAGKRLTATLSPAPDVIALVFASAEDSAMVLWSWRPDAQTTRVEMYLGPSPQVTTLLGSQLPNRMSGGSTILEVNSAPLIVTGLHSSQALLQASFRVAPRNLQLHDPESRPTVMFRNPYSMPLVGDMIVRPPEDWKIVESTTHFELAPGESLTQPLSFVVPPQQLASTHGFQVKLRLRTPEDATLDFSERLTIGLNDIELTTVPSWHGEDLYVEQSLRNRSDRPVSFMGFCAAPNRPRAEAIFAEVGAGESMSRTYVFTRSRDLAIRRLHMGVREIRGDRRLNQLVDVPSP
ncbi:MAG: hypothetical protein HZB38_12340 [Planctomycetes bacterium]|nr:hypothetical protein [Planctomycetota bacterium]